MIIECIVTTINGSGEVNFAPMGVTIAGDRIAEGDQVWLRPFRTTTTFANLARSRAAVAHATDDVLQFARCALEDVQLPWVPAAAVRGAVVLGACHHWELSVEAIDAAAERAEVACRVVARGHQRDFSGFNRAQAAVIEAVILATRTHLLDLSFIRGEYERLWIPVRKTGGEREHAAMRYLEERLEELLRGGAAHVANARP